MLSRCRNNMVTAVLLISTLLFGFVQAGTEDQTRLGNKTIDRTLQIRTHSIYAPYIDQDLQNRWWDFGADAYINTNKYIRLTRNVPSQMGWLWSRLPFTGSNFVIEVEFKVSGDSNLFGDGLAVWLTKDRVQPGPVFGNQDEFDGLGIFLDTYANSREHTYSFPRIVAILGDGKTKYNHGNDGDDQAIGACSANFRRTNVATKLKLTYVKDNFLDLKIQYKAWDDWTDCFSIPKIALPPNPFLGFTAMTGDVSDAHDIISVSSYTAVMSRPNSAPNKLKERSLSGGGTWVGFFFKVFLLGGVVAGGYYGYQEYLRRQRYGGGGGYTQMFSSNSRY